MLVVEVAVFKTMAHLLEALEVEALVLVVQALEEMQLQIQVVAVAVMVMLVLMVVPAALVL
jgi:hypothetical protein